MHNKDNLMDVPNHDQAVIKCIFIFLKFGIYYSSLV